MPQDQVILVILAVAILANVLLLATIPLRIRARRRSLQADQPRPDGPASTDPRFTQAAASDATEPGTDMSGRRDVRDDGDAGVVAAIEAFVAEVSTDAAGRTRAPAPSEVLSRRRDAITSAAPDTAAQPSRTSTRRHDRGAPGTPTVPVPAHSARAPAWSVAGLADPATWERTVREEAARVARFSRPVTVVMAELPRLDDVAARLGRAAADRVVTETARLLVAEGRAVDHIAWLDYARFAVLLMETEEIRASDYVGRVRAAADSWLQSAGLSVRLSLGWASPAEDGDILAAAATAQERMRHPDGQGSHEVAGEPGGS